MEKNMTNEERVINAISNIHQAREEFEAACTKLYNSLLRYSNMDLSDALIDYEKEPDARQALIRNARKVMAETNVRMSAINGIKCLM